MTLTFQSNMRNRFYCWLSVFAVVLATSFLRPTQVSAEKISDEPKVLGFQQCVDCHEMPAEAWRRSSHSQRSLAMLSNNLRAERYATRLGIAPSKIASDARCTNCHGTRQEKHNGIVQVNHGVSCESCHGPAGDSLASEGWYGLHSREDELSEAEELEHANALREAGMAGVENLYSLAVRCYECHSVSDEEVVAAGHVAGTPDFELTIWFSGEVRHNFAPHTIDVEDDEINSLASNIWLAAAEERKPAARKRIMFVVGQLADLEVNLRNRAKATTEGTFATSAASRSIAAHARLKQIASQIDSAELRELLVAVDPVIPMLFLPTAEDHQKKFNKAADSVARLAVEFTTQHDGTQLAAIDSLMPEETKGNAFQPE